jgi:hypothetical protein
MDMMGALFMIRRKNHLSQEYFEVAHEAVKAMRKAGNSAAMDF